jgi:hypothetical protein
MASRSQRKGGPTERRVARKERSKWSKEQAIRNEKGQARKDKKKG